MEHVIRNANIDDADAIGAVVVRAWQAAYRGIMPDDYLDELRAEQRAAMWHRVLADLGPDRCVHVLTVGDELVGFASYGPELADVSDGETGQLYAINLDPDHWGRGLGRALLTDEVAGVLLMSATTLPCCGSPPGTSVPADCMSPRAGQPRVPQRDDEILGVIVNEVRYRKRLNALSRSQGLGGSWSSSSNVDGEDLLVRSTVPSLRRPTPISTVQ